MSVFEVRPFERRDREQLAGLVNRHVSAVLPGVALSVNTVMGQLEREPSEGIVDPWVVERRSLVCLFEERVVAAALVLRYGGKGSVGEDYRDTAEIRWLVCDPAEPRAGERVMSACMQLMDGWAVSRRFADGSLPSLATYGVPACWPHIRKLYEASGFVQRGKTEVILVAGIDELPASAPLPIPGATVRRSVGDCGTRFTVVLGDETVGYIEVDTDATQAGTRQQFRAWADIGNLHVSASRPWTETAVYLLVAAADWLRLGRIERVLAYVWPEEHDRHSFLTAHGFRELTRTDRRWQHEGTAVNR
ncbi:MAG: N-acetyltransferase [Actinomycetota bacterium]|nr:N-acetyltransferase [Actinomycetota bacterium]